MRQKLSETWNFYNIFVIISFFFHNFLIHSLHIQVISSSLITRPSLIPNIPSSHPPWKTLQTIPIQSFILFLFFFLFFLLFILLFLLFFLLFLLFFLLFFLFLLFTSSFSCSFSSFYGFSSFFSFSSYFCFSFPFYSSFSSSCLFFSSLLLLFTFLIPRIRWSLGLAVQFPAH